MSGTDGGYRLPEVIDPTERICVTLRIPNEQNHIAAFWGALLQLSHWTVWERDTLKRGKDVAAVWQSILLAAISENSSLECPLIDVRQNIEEPCILEKSEDGLTWEPFADLLKCPPRLRRNPVNGNIESTYDGIGWFEVPDGPWEDSSGQPQYPPPEPRTEDTTEERRCLAAANAENVIHATFNSTCDYLSLTNNTATDIAVGVGTIIAALLFASVGWIFLVPIIGVMIAASVIFNRADYDSGVAETMRDILYCRATDTAGTVTFDFDGVREDVQAEIGLPFPALDYMLQFITADGLNVAGGTTAITEADCSDAVCPEEWCYTFNFLEGAEGWTSDGLDGIYLAQWDVGEGWGTTEPGNPSATSYVARSAAIKIDFGVTAYVTTMSIGLSGGNAQNAMYRLIDDTYDDHLNLGIPPSFTVDADATGIGLLIDKSNVGSITSRITNVTLRGIGVNPFGEDNCE